METSGNFVTETNKSPLVQSLTLFFLASGVICALCRLYTKWVVVTFVAADDYFVPISTLLLVVQSVAVTVMTANGYGKASLELSSAQTAAIFKAQYTAMLLYIPSLLFSKLPTIVILNMISPVARFHKLLMIMYAIILSWAVTSMFVAAFQCQPPNTWDYIHAHCINRIGFSTYFETMNGLTDIILVILPFTVVGKVKISLRRKFQALSVFCVRLIVLPAIVAKVVLSWSHDGEDPLFGTWTVTICTQLIQFLSLLSACVLYLRPFMQSLTSGFINGDDLRRRGQIKPYIINSEEYSEELTATMYGSNGQPYSHGEQPASKLESPNETGIDNSNHLSNSEEKQHEDNSTSTRSPIASKERKVIDREKTVDFEETFHDHLTQRNPKHGSHKPLPTKPPSELMRNETSSSGFLPIQRNNSQSDQNVPILHNEAMSDRNLPAPSQEITPVSSLSTLQHDPPSIDSLSRPGPDSTSPSRPPTSGNGPSPVSELDRPSMPRQPILLGENGLPRVSQVYSPLTNSDNIRTFITDEDRTRLR